MRRAFSNGPAKDFVINPFKEMIQGAVQVCVAAPFVTETADLIAVANKGTSVKLLVGLNSSTDPKALTAAHGRPGLSIRYFTGGRFHAKIYLVDSAALVGSSNLTDGGLRANREATVCLEESRDHDTIDELRALFWELWESSRVLTTETLNKFTAAHGRFKRPDTDSLIESAIGKAPPPNITVGSEKKTSDLLFREQLFRQVYEQYRPSFNEVTKILEENHFRRPELASAGGAQETNRFLNWVKLTYAVGEDSWDSTPLRNPEQRKAVIVDLGQEWATTDNNKVPHDYLDWLQNVRSVFGTAGEVEGASKEHLTEGLMSLHAFSEQTRFVKKGNLPDAFWKENDGNIDKVRQTLRYLIHGGGEFINRLHDVLYDPSRKLGYFGLFCALELYGTLRPEDCPPINGRMAKALRYLGFDVRGT